MTAKDRIIIQHAKRIIKLEKDIALANARICALEARPTVITMSLIFTPPTVTPRAPWPNYPSPGATDFILSPTTTSGNATSPKIDNLQVRQ
jgi:hypothetical protein